MNSIIDDTPPTLPEIKFPCLMESLDNGRIVLFIDAYQGTIVHPGKLGINLGLSQSDWIAAHDDTTWKLFRGSVQLSND